jgi:hypothetical protein
MLFGVQWYYWIVLIISIILLIFAWSKVLRSSRARRERLKKEAEIWKRDYELREKFTVLTDDKIKETEEIELLHGVAMNIQVMLEAETDMAAKFDALPEEKKFIYALEYFDEDAKKSLSGFFKNNGKPLVPVIPAALNAIGCEKYIPIITPLMEMYDPDSDASVDNTIIAKADEEFSSTYNSDELCRLSARFIIKNKDIFLS